MCSYCLRDVCPPGCPNYEDPVIGICEDCGHVILAGEEYLRTENTYLCDECFTNMSRIEVAEFLGAEFIRGDACA